MAKTEILDPGGGGAWGAMRWREDERDFAKWGDLPDNSMLDGHYADGEGRGEEREGGET